MQGSVTDSLPKPAVRSFCSLSSTGLGGPVMYFGVLLASGLCPRRGELTETRSQRCCVPASHPWCKHFPSGKPLFNSSIWSNLAQPPLSQWRCATRPLPHQSQACPRRMQAPLGHPSPPSKAGLAPVCLDSQHPHPACALTAHQRRGDPGEPDPGPERGVHGVVRPTPARYSWGATGLANTPSLMAPRLHKLLIQQGV
ncbi:unnamed protein product [Rangifer tarandus platyrhynchus]|uniref:Uncharacterized protein n=1 Tax=Rangifer tarandus platyrhynchus TaxID=3082113 RepID=A0AC59Z4D7_RANTA